MEVPEVDRKETVGRVPGEESRPRVKNIYLRGHCVLCLRKLKDGQITGYKALGNLNEVPEAELPQNVVSTVNWVWDALKVGQEGNGDIFGPRSGPGVGTKFGGVPKLCVECSGIVLGVDKLLKEVRREIGELRRLLRRCKEQGSCRQFVRTLHNLGLDQGVVADTMEFLEDVRSRIEPEVVPEQELVSSEEDEDPSIPFIPWTSESARTEDPLAIDDFDPDPEFVAYGDDQDDTDTDEFEDGTSEDEDYIPSKSKRAKLDNKSKTSSRCQQQNKSSPSPKQKPVTHQIPQTFETDYVKEEVDDEWFMPDDSHSSVEPDPLSSPQPTSTSSFRFTSGGTMTTQESTMPVYPAPEVPTVSSVLTPNEEMEHLVCQIDNCDQRFEGKGGALKMKLHQKVAHNLQPAGVDIPKSAKDDIPEVARLKIKIPPGASSSINRDEAEEPLYMTIKPPLNKPKYFVCLLDNCGYHFEGKMALRDLQAHQVKHRENKDKDKPIETWSVTKRLAKKGNRKYLRNIFKCELCDKKGWSSTELKDHLKEKHNVDPGIIKVHNERNFMQSCELCKLRLPQKQLLEHVKGHVGEEYTFQCPNPDCEFVCVTQYQLFYHLKNVGDRCRQKAGIDIEEFKIKQRTCTICRFTAKNLNSLRHHLLQEHESPEKNYPCPISGCGMKFTLRESVVLHLGQHDFSPNVETQPCLDCEDKKQVKLEEMEAHLKEVHGVQEAVNCLRCSFRFSSREHLVGHMFEHRHICGEAGGRFPKHARLVEHYFTQHQIGKQFVCEHENCSKVFLKRESLLQHVEVGHQSKNDAGKIQAPKQTFDCEDCERVFKSKNGFISHRIRLHGDPPLSCKFCSQTFHNGSEQREHERVVHKGIPKAPSEFPCEEPNCGKVFKSKKLLTYHLKYTHLGEKGNHVCELCGKCKRSPADLREHKEIFHLGIRKYICESCGEAFTSDTTLKRHRLIHTGERPFACDHDHCGQRFRTKDVLGRHLKGHQRKGADFKPNGPMKKIRKRVQPKTKADHD